MPDTSTFEVLEVFVVHKQIVTYVVMYSFPPGLLTTFGDAPRVMLQCIT